MIGWSVEVFFRSEELAARQLVDTFVFFKTVFCDHNWAMPIRLAGSRAMGPTDSCKATSK